MGNLSASILGESSNVIYKFFLRVVAGLGIDHHACSSEYSTSSFWDLLETKTTEKETVSKMYHFSPHEID